MNEHDCPLTYARPDGIGAFQISVAEYESGVVPYATNDDLIELGVALAKHHSMEIKASEAGACTMGRYGFVQCLEGEFHTLIWHLADGRDFVLATFTAGSLVAAEVRDIWSMVRSLHLEP